MDFGFSEEQELLRDQVRRFMRDECSMQTVRALSGRGHRIRDEIGIYGGYQAILYDAENGVYYGASESRKDGQAAGY